METDLQQVDTFEAHHGKKPWRLPWQKHQVEEPWCLPWQSALEVIVKFEVEGFVKNALFNKLIEEKWFKFARRMYILRRLLPHVLLIVVFMAVVVLRAGEVHEDWAQARGGGGGGGGNVAAGWEGAIPVGDPTGVGCIGDVRAWLSDTEGEPKDRHARRLASVALEGVLAFALTPMPFFRGLRLALHRSVPDSCCGSCLAGPCQLLV